MRYRRTNTRWIAASKRRGSLLGLCVGLMYVAACGRESVGGGDSPLAEPDLGPDAIVCGEPGYPANTDGTVADLAGCEIFQGYVTFSSHITDPTPLASLRVIRGGVGAGGYNARIERLEGLENLEWVGEFSFLGDGVQDLSGVGQLEKVGGNFRLDALENVTDLHGLERLRIIGGSASMSRNPNLMSLDGLAGLERVMGDLTITSNPNLPRDQVDALLARIEVGGEVHVD